MNASLAFTAALCSISLGFAVLLRKRRSPAGWLFLIGMAVLGLESALAGMSLRAATLEGYVNWTLLAFVAKACVPGVWLAFSLVYSRGNFRDFLLRWRVVLGGAFVVPLGLVIALYARWWQPYAGSMDGAEEWYALGWQYNWLHVALLLGSVLVLINLEKTFRSAVGTLRWRVKFAMIGFAVLFGARIYTQSQGILFKGSQPSLAVIDAWALLVACGVIALAHVRRGFDDLDLYPSRAALQTSVTVVLVGSYLMIVGVLAQVVNFLGGVGSFQAQAFIILLGMVGLSALLLSDRARLTIRAFVSQHFKRPEHDFHSIWEQFTQETAQVLERGAFCEVVAKLVSKTFNALSVSLFVVDQRNRQLILAASTGEARPDKERPHALPELSMLIESLSRRDAPIDLDRVDDEWALVLREATPMQFTRGGHRIGVPLEVRDQFLGIVILADRVDAMPYTQEERDLLLCLAGQTASGLLNLDLTEELIDARELSAFQTMSTFFVHDLKNLASRLNLMLGNMRDHFDDPEFRRDALRTIESTAQRIDQLIERMSALRPGVATEKTETEFNQLIQGIVKNLESAVPIAFSTRDEPLPRVRVDCDQLHSVVTNLVMNGFEAQDKQGTIAVTTSQAGKWVTVSVTDRGCGMSSEFIRNGLFRPFQSTKKNGFGVGMFQCKAIVEAHGGRIWVDSVLGEGTRFQVGFPVVGGSEPKDGEECENLKFLGANS